MNVTLSNVKIAHHLSQETYAFTAKLLVDGEIIASVRNAGTGGCQDLDPVGHEGGFMLKEAKAWARDLPGFDHEEYGTLPMDLDFWISLHLENL